MTPALVAPVVAALAVTQLLASSSFPEVAAVDIAGPASCRFDEKGSPPPSSWLKLLDAPSRALAREGCRHSPTFRRLVGRIEALQGFVYVASTLTLAGGREGALLHRIQLTSDGRRCLWVVVRRDRLSPYRIGVLAHELQHAIEVLQETGLLDSSDIEPLFRRLRPGVHGQTFETDAALALGDRVVREVAEGGVR